MCTKCDIRPINIDDAFYYLFVCTFFCDKREYITPLKTVSYESLYIEATQVAEYVFW